VREEPFNVVESVHNLGSMSPSRMGGQNKDNIMDKPQSDECGNKLLMMLRVAKALL
jgi:hypothetical protein